MQNCDCDSRLYESADYTHLVTFDISEPPLEAEVWNQAQRAVCRCQSWVLPGIRLVVVPVLLIDGRKIVDIDDLHIPTEIAPAICSLARKTYIKTVREWKTTTVQIGIIGL